MERVAQVFLAKWELFGEESFRKRFLGFLFRMVGKDHHAISNFPITWDGNPLFCSQLERELLQESLKVPASGSWVKDRQLLFLIRTKTNTRSAITGTPFLSFSAGSHMPNRIMRSRFLPSMTGKGSFSVGTSQL